MTEMHILQVPWPFGFTTCGRLITFTVFRLTFAVFLPQKFLHVGVRYWLVYACSWQWVNQWKRKSFGKNGYQGWPIVKWRWRWLCSGMDMWMVILRKIKELVVSSFFGYLLLVIVASLFPFRHVAHRNVAPAIDWSEEKRTRNALLRARDSGLWLCWARDFFFQN